MQRPKHLWSQPWAISLLPTILLTPFYLAVEMTYGHPALLVGVVAFGFFYLTYGLGRRLWSDD